MNAPRHLYLDHEQRLCAEDDPNAAELLAAEGSPIPTKRLHAAGLTLDDVRAHVEAAQAPAEETPVAEEPEKPARSRR